MKERTMGMGCRMVLLLVLLLAFLCWGGVAGAEGEKDLTVLLTGNFMGQVMPQKG